MNRFDGLSSLSAALLAWALLGSSANVSAQGEPSPGDEPAEAHSAEAHSVEAASLEAASLEAPSGQDEPTPDAPPAEDELGIRATAEIGFLAVLSHELTLGSDGTQLDYPSDFAQSNLYLYLRASVDVDIWRQHILTFVYQPIDIETLSTLPRTVRIDGLDYAQGTPVRARYSFPFYRFGWAFDVLSDPHEELAFGIGLQIRNAAIEFESQDGAQFRSRNDVGPVPLLRARGRLPIAPSWSFQFDVDGFYAFIPGLNGSDNSVEGAIVDASARLAWRVVPHLEAFLSVRYIAGGAVGEGDPTATSDGFQRNWLHFLAVSVGATLDSRP